MDSKRTQKMCLTIGLAFLFSMAGDAKADFTFGEPTNLGPTINTSSGDWPDCFSSDGLEMYLTCMRPGGYGNWDIWVSTRESIDDDWGEPTNLGPKVNGPQPDLCACISFNGLVLYFMSTHRPGGHGGHDIWVSTRQTKDSDWGEPENLGPVVNSSSGEGSPWLTTDGLELYFSSRRSGGYGSSDIWVTRRATINDPWGEPVNLGAVVNSSACEVAPFISADGLSLFFSEDLGGPYRPGGFGNVDMWVTRRASVNDSWETPVNLGPMVNSSSLDCGPRISPDGSMLYFSSERPGGYGGYYGDIYQAPIIPIVDFNGDRIVDATDVCIMVNHWGENFSLCDIGPTPIGDGIVDVQDLIVLAKHLFEDDRLVAHWALDEVKGDIAYDSTGEHNGTLHGEPVWQPYGGMVAGALQLDGVDDYINTAFVLNPADVPFSVTAWIKGGAPGQVMISQADTVVDTPVGPSINPGSAWLTTTSSEGGLMTGLGDAYFGPLVSESVITDDQWHHIALVYARTTLKRHLYVDGAEVAVDSSYVIGESCDAGLYIGAGQDLNASTFFSGLIDDVRIYNQALTAEQIEGLSQ